MRLYCQPWSIFSQSAAPTKPAAKLDGLFHAHPALKNENGYSESYCRCQMKQEPISKLILNFHIELNCDFWQF